MRSELLLIPIQLAGIPLFGFGILLAIWVGLAILVLVRHWKAKGADGEFYGYLPLFAVGAVVLIGLPRLFPDGLPIRGYGVMVLLGSVSGFWLALQRSHLAGVSQDQISGLAFWMFVFGILGARLFFVAEYWNEIAAGKNWLQILREVLKFTEGGLVVYGSLIGAALAYFAFCRKHHLPMLRLADVVGPSLVVGLAFGRVGCLLNGCCYGGVCDLPWAVTFPQLHNTHSDELSPAFADQLTHGELHGLRISADLNGVRIERAPAGAKSGELLKSLNQQTVHKFEQAAALLSKAYFHQQPLEIETASGQSIRIPAAPLRSRSLPVHPAQIYESITAAILAWLSWAFFPFRPRDGAVMALLLTFYPLCRILQEIIRVDESAVWGTGLSISQNISLAILAAMIPAWWLLLRRPRPQDAV